MTLYDRIYNLCVEHGIAMTALESKLGFSNGSICKLKSSGSPSVDRLQKIANYFHVSMDYLMTGEEPHSNIPDITYKIEKRKIPLLEKFASGKPVYANEDMESYAMAGKETKADFCLIASGDSMINSRINDGDIVFVQMQDIVKNGEIAVVLVNNDEVTLKRFYYYQEKALLILKSDNPACPDLIFQNEELNHVHVIGKVIAFQSNIN